VVYRDEDQYVNQLLRESEKLFHYDLEIETDRITALKERAEELISSHGNVARLILARVACLAKDEATMRRHHYAILETNPDDSSSFRDYSESLRKMGYYSQARETSRRAHELAPANSELLRTLVKNCVISGYFQASWRYLDLAIKANARVMTREYNFLSQAVHFFKDSGVSDLELERVQHIAMAVLRLEELTPIGVLRSPAVHMEFLHGPPPLAGEATNEHRLFLMWGIQTAVRGDHLGILNERLYQAISRSQLDPRILSFVKIRFFNRTREGMMSTGFNY